jgi:hypothetical protein
LADQSVGERAAPTVDYWVASRVAQKAVLMVVSKEHI